MKKKICFVVASPMTIDAFLINHIKTLSREFDVYLVANFKNCNLEEYVSLGLIEVKSINIRRKVNVFFDTISLIQLFLYFKNKRFDFVHSVTPKAGLLTQTAGFFANIRFRIHIFTGQVWFTEKGLKRCFLKFFDKIICFFSTEVLVDGQSQREFLINEKVISTNSKVLGRGSISGVDIYNFKPDLNLRIEIRKKLSIKVEDFVIIFLGRLNKDKGIFDLIEAFLTIDDKYKNLVLIICGPDEEKIQEKVTSRSQNILFLGQVNNPKDFLVSSDLFCLPSYREGFGTSVIEASACGLPVLVSDTYGLKDAFQENLTGLKHKVGDISDLVNILSFMINNPEKCLEMGRAGRFFIESNFDKNLVSNEWLNFYKNL